MTDPTISQDARVGCPNCDGPDHPCDWCYFDETAAKGDGLATEAHNLFARLDGHFDADEVELCDRILTALTQAPRSCWQPIETAPKTGKDLRAKPFLGWCLDDTAPVGGDIRVCWWEPHIDGGRWHGDRDLPEHPTHWQPLPEPPATAIRSNSHDG